VAFRAAFVALPGAFAVARFVAALRVLLMGTSVSGRAELPLLRPEGPDLGVGLRQCPDEAGGVGTDALIEADCKPMFLATAMVIRRSS
jgi:hypothetical protein